MAVPVAIHFPCHWQGNIRIFCLFMIYLCCLISFMISSVCFDFCNDYQNVLYFLHFFFITSQVFYVAILTQHISVLDMSNFTCNICNKSFPKAANLRMHVKRTHTDTVTITINGIIFLHSYF